MNGLRHIALLFALVSFVGGCGPYVKITRLTSQDVIEKDYFSFSPPDSGWYCTGEPWVLQANGKAQFVEIYNHPKGASYQIDVEAWPFKWNPYQGYFDKNARYKKILKDEEMELDENDKEQGIGYVRQWVSYIRGMKCTEGVFSRSPVGAMRGASSKNYSLTCGYYDKTEGKRLLHISYSYMYAGGSVRLQKDADTLRDQLISLEEAELGLKRAVKQLVESIRIKNMDRERMEREGLLHYDKQYEISPY